MRMLGAIDQIALLAVKFFRWGSVKQRHQRFVTGTCMLMQNCVRKRAIDESGLLLFSFLQKFQLQQQVRAKREHYEKCIERIEAAWFYRSRTNFE